VPARSQGPNKFCIQDTCAEPWGLTQTIQLQLANGCWVEVSYAMRNGCGINPSYCILGFRMLTPQCSWTSLKNLFGNIEQLLITANPLGVPPPAPGTCRAPIPVVKPTCWKRDTTFCNDTVYTFCDMHVCCVTYYGLCADFSGHLFAPPLSWMSTGGCDSSWNRTCDSVCGPADSGWYSITRKGGVPDPARLSKASRDQQLQELGATVLSVAPKQGASEILYEVSTPSEVVLAIDDISGNEVLRLVKGRHEPGKYAARVEAGALPPGEYHYRLLTSEGWSFGQFNVK
jgi:hypothetical protein